MQYVINSVGHFADPLVMIQFLSWLDFYYCRCYESQLTQIWFYLRKLLFRMLLFAHDPEIIQMLFNLVICRV